MVREEWYYMCLCCAACVVLCIVYVVWVLLVFGHTSSVPSCAS